MSMTPLFVPTNYRWSVVLLNFWKHALKLSFFKRSSTAKVWYFQLERQAICVVSSVAKSLKTATGLIDYHLLTQAMIYRLILPAGEADTSDTGI